MSPSSLDGSSPVTADAAPGVAGSTVTSSAADLSLTRALIQPLLAASGFIPSRLDGQGSASETATATQTTMLPPETERLFAVAVQPGSKRGSDGLDAVFAQLGNPDEPLDLFAADASEPWV